MFGRRKIPFGSAPPPPPAGKEPFPIDKMDRALDGAIRLLTRALDEAGEDPGGLAIRGPVPSGVTKTLAESITYRGQDDGGMSYITLGLTPDLKAFLYPPHCRLFLIINATGLAEDPISADLRCTIARSQFKTPLVYAHLMRRWIRYILPTNDALRGGSEALARHMENIIRDLTELKRSVPQAWAGEIDVDNCLEGWTDGLPGCISHPLNEGVERMNGLPVTPFIAKTLTNFLAEMQMRGISQRG